MTRAIRKLKGVLDPKPGSSAKLDIAILIIFGTWFLGGVIAIITDNPDPNAYKCSGPGFIDFGCNGGWEAVAANVFGAVFGLFILCVFLVSLARITNRWEKYRSAKIKDLKR